MYKMLSVFVLLALYLPVFGQEVSFRVVEVKGSVDVKDREGNWRQAEEGDLLINGTEIFTGLHSHLSLEIGDKSYVTINQLSRALINNLRVQKDLINSEIYLINGYVILNSQKGPTYSNVITVTFMDGGARFDNSGGEIYLRKEIGAVIKCSKGKVKIINEISNRYNLYDNETCAILPGGRLVESDYFLKRKAANKPADLLNPEADRVYFDRLFNYGHLE